MLSTAIQTKISSILSAVAYGVGYSINDVESRNYIQVLLEAGVEDMLKSGVTEETILDSKIVVSALTIFVNDNLNMSAGKHITSVMYIANVDKLRETNI